MECAGGYHHTHHDPKAHPHGGNAGNYLGHCPVGRIPGEPRRRGWDQPGGQVGRDGAQVGEGPRRQRLADPQVKLSFDQPSLHERGLKNADRLLAVGVASPEVPPSGRCPVAWFRQPRHPTI
jgi:hypothetical protein